MTNVLAIHSAEELAQLAAERAYEAEQDEAREIYREWHGYYDGNSGYTGGDDLMWAGVQHWDYHVRVSTDARTTSPHLGSSALHLRIASAGFTFDSPAVTFS